MQTGIYLEYALPGSQAAMSGRRERLYIFLTRHGLFFCCMLFGMLLGAVNYNNSMAYLWVFLLISIFMVCLLHTYRNMRGLVVEPGRPAPVFAGQLACFPLLINNHGWQARTGIRIQPWPEGKNDDAKQPTDDLQYHINLHTDGLHTCEISLPARERGYLSLGRLRLCSVYPMGLFRAWSYLYLEQPCLIYPHPAGNPTLPGVTAFDSDALSGSRAGVDEFTGFRNYHQGDPLRHIHWRALAREQGPLIKLHQGEGGHRLVLHWDLTRHLNDTESRLSQLCLWVLQAEQQGSAYQLRLPGSSTEFGQGDAHKHRCLTALATYGLSE